MRQHGYSKRRIWRKLHLGVDEATGEILAMELTTNDVTDDEVFPDLFDQIDGKVICVSVDGAYDKQRCYDTLDPRHVQANIPQRWKKESGYHRRSLSETAMFRFKSLFGGTLSNRIFDHQVTEAIIKCQAINKMTQLGMPDSQLVT